METLKLHCLKFHNAVFDDFEIEKLASEFRAAGKLSLDQAFAVYRQGHQARAIEALGEIYDTLWRFLGDQAFFKLIENYIAKHPSRFRNLAEWGEGLVGYLGNKSLVFEREIARLDWARQEIFHRKRELFPIHEFPGLSFQRNFCLITSPLKILDLWQAIHNNSLESASEFESPQTVLIFAAPAQLKISEIDADAAALLKSLVANEGSLEAALEDWQNLASTEITESLIQESVAVLRQIEWITEEAAIEPQF